jgi:hypothetical protein
MKRIKIDSEKLGAILFTAQPEHQQDHSRYDRRCRFSRNDLRAAWFFYRPYFERSAGK